MTGGSDRGGGGEETSCEGRCFVNGRAEGPGRWLTSLALAVGKENPLPGCSCTLYSIRLKHLFWKNRGFVLHPSSASLALR